MFSLGFHPLLCPSFCLEQVETIAKQTADVAKDVFDVASQITGQVVDAATPFVKAATPVVIDATKKAVDAATPYVTDLAGQASKALSEQGVELAPVLSASKVSLSLICRQYFFEVHTLLSILHLHSDFCIKFHRCDISSAFLLQGV